MQNTNKSTSNSKQSSEQGFKDEKILEGDEIDRNVEDRLNNIKDISNSNSNSTEDHKNGIKYTQQKLYEPILNPQHDVAGMEEKNTMMQVLLHRIQCLESNLVQLNQHVLLSERRPMNNFPSHDYVKSTADELANSRSSPTEKHVRIINNTNKKG